jgi:hypothetical protein
MEMREAFAGDEWSRVVAAPMLASMAITAGEPSGLIGTIRESFSVAAAIQTARGTEGGNALVEAVANAYDTAEGRASARAVLQDRIKDRPRAEVAHLAVAALAEVAGIVEARAPKAAAGFKDWIRAVARSVADAATEGAILGIGGERVSEDERATLAEIDRVLG